VAVVEFALVAPIFILLVLGMIEVGRMIMVQQVLTNAAREGARVGVLKSSGETEVRDRVNEYMETARLSGFQVDPDLTEEQVTVRVSIPVSQVSWIPLPRYFAQGANLASTTVMRRELDQ
jgi:Flp pilus assembly protein TadG